MAESIIGTIKAVLAMDAEQFDKAIGKAQGKLKGFGDASAKAGKTLSLKLTAPIVGAGAGAFKMAMDFEHSMTQIQSLVGRSAEEVADLSEHVKRLSGETARSPKELADAMFFITSAGLDASSAVRALEFSAKASASGLGDTVAIADAVTNAMNGYGLSAEQASYATDVLTKTVEQGKASAEDLAPTFGKIIPVASELGVEFDQIGAGMAFLTRSSGDANASATQLRGILNSILKPSSQAKEALEQIGFSSQDFRKAVKDEGLLEGLLELRSRLEGNGLEMANVFENTRALAGALQLTGVQADQAVAVFAELEKSAGKTDEAFAIASETTRFKFDKAMAQFKLTMIEVGEKVIPIVLPLIEKLANFVGSLSEKFSNMSPFMQKVILGFTGLLAVMGPSLIVVGKMAHGINGLVTMFGKLASSAGFGKGAGGVLSKFGKVLGAHPKIAIASAVAIGVAGVAFAKFRKRAEEARKRQKGLTEEFIKAGDPTATQVQRLRDMAQELKAVEEGAEGTAMTFEGLAGEQTLYNLLLKDKVVPQFEALGLSMEDTIEVISTGTDEFQRLKEKVDLAGMTNAKFVEELRKVTGAESEVTNAIANRIEAEELSLDQARKILYSLDETADAFDDHNKKLKENAKEYIESGDAMSDYADILGVDTVASLIAGINEGKTFQEVLDDIETEANKAKDTQEKVNAGFEEFDVVMGDLSGFTMPDMVDATEEVAKSEEELAQEIEEANQKMQDQIDLTNELKDQLRSLADPLFAVALAEADVIEASEKLTEALTESNGQIGTQTQESRDALNAMADYTDKLDDFASELIDLPMDEVNTKFQDQRGYIDELKDANLISNEQFDMLNRLLDDAYEQIGLINDRELIIAGTADISPQLQNLLNNVTQAGGLANFGAQITGFIGGAVPMAKGGIITKPTFIQAGEQGAEAIIPLNQAGNMLGGGTTVNVVVEGSVLSEMDLADAIQAQLIRTKNRNASLEFG
jgi:TP901 family phage tail tape measure protein